MALCFLYVEDREALRIAAELAIKAFNATYPDVKLTVAASYKEAVGKLEQGITNGLPFNVAILDWHFSGKEDNGRPSLLGSGGLDFFQYIREHSNSAVANMSVAIYSGTDFAAIRHDIRQRRLDLLPDQIFSKQSSDIHDVIKEMHAAQVLRRPEFGSPLFPKTEPT